MSFNAAISTCEKRQQWQQALGMLSEMEHCCSCCCCCCCCFLLLLLLPSQAAAVSKAKCQWQQALGMLSEMEHQHLEPNVISFNAAIGGREKGN